MPTIPAPPGWRAHLAPLALFAFAVLLPLAVWWSVRGHTGAASITIAVLPFENLSREPGRDYLADGLTEETIAALGQVDPAHVRVVGRHSTLAYKRSGRPPADMRKELRLDYAVESSLRAEGPRGRVRSKLVRIHDGTPVWSASHDADPAGLLALQRALSAAVAGEIRLGEAPRRLDALDRRHTRHPEAHDLYLRGRYFWNQLTPSTTREAIRHFERATQLDRDYALAWAGLAEAWVSRAVNGDAPPLEALPPARDAAEQAVRAGPDLAESQTSQALVEFWEGGDWAGAEARLRRAVSLDPAYEPAHRMLGVVLAHAGRPDEAQRAMERSRALEPLMTATRALWAHLAALAGRHEEAAAFALQAEGAGPQFWAGHVRLDLGAPTGDVPPYARARAHAGRGEREAALQWLERAQAARDVHLVDLPLDPQWDSLRADPRFQALLARRGAAPARATPRPAS
jgi:TolB-like protein/Tfp pilus assembly protein PilF